MSDDLTKAAPAVVQQRFVLPCAACGAGPAPEPASHCWWCGEELKPSDEINPMKTEPEEKEWVMPNPGTTYRILTDSPNESGERLATGIRNLSDGSLADIVVADEDELRALGWRTLRMPDKPDQNGSLSVQSRVGVLPHLLNLALKIANSGKRLGKLLLERFKGRSGHGVVGVRQNAPHEPRVAETDNRQSANQ